MPKSSVLCNLQLKACFNQPKQPPKNNSNNFMFNHY